MGAAGAGVAAQPQIWRVQPSLLRMSDADASMSEADLEKARTSLQRLVEGPPGSSEFETKPGGFEFETRVQDAPPGRPFGEWSASIEMSQMLRVPETGETAPLLDIRGDNATLTKANEEKAAHLAQIRTLVGKLNEKHVQLKALPTGSPGGQAAQEASLARHLVRLPEVNFIDDKAGKPVGINQHIGRRPVIAVGNSDGDFQMLEWTTAGEGARLGTGTSRPRER